MQRVVTQLEEWLVTSNNEFVTRWNSIKGKKVEKLGSLFVHKYFCLLI